MRYVLCIIPPLAVLSCGKPVTALLNLFLTLLLYVPGFIHAIMVVNAYQADQRAKKIVKAVEKSSARRE